MKLSESFFYTLREDQKEDASISSNLLIRSGMIKKVGAGIYMFLPLGLKTLHNIEQVVRDEMNKAGANELLMPCLLPIEVYEKSGRANAFGDDMFTLTDRADRKYALGPTHEELFCMAAKEKIKSYKDMPFNIYQIGNKYRDEARSRYGLIRVREFIMKDAYSFDRDKEHSKKSYAVMKDAYIKIFNRLGIDYKIVRADTGAMGGSLSEEFQAITDIGEDTVVLCDSCDYASNIEVSICPKNEKENKMMTLPKELVETPNQKTIAEISNFLGEDASNFVKTLIYKIDGEFFAVLIKGDREVNEAKLAKYLNARSVELANIEEVEKITNAKVGFAGPIGLSIPILMDEDILMMKNFIVGANKTDYHYKNVNTSDFTIQEVFDLKTVQEGDVCPKCSGKLYFKKGIEIGNIFLLDTHYSEKLDLTYLDENNELKYVDMGCYGIGIGRILAAACEQHNDEHGLILPIEMAPFKVNIIIINSKDEIAVKQATELYNALNEIGIDAMLDDRDERPGVKFKDNDLIGIPLRITFGKKLAENKVELKVRSIEESYDVSLDDILSEIEKRLQI